MLNHLSKRGPRQQILTWTNIGQDLGCHMASLECNGLMIKIAVLGKQIYIYIYLANDP